MLTNFIYSWLIYWGMVLVQPVHSIYPAVTEAFVLQVIFVVLVCIGYIIVNVGLSSPKMPYLMYGNIIESKVIIRYSILFSLVGIIFLVYDKIFIQGIDYTNGLAVAREQWREIGEERGGQASSIWSALGYLVGSAYYVALIVLVTQSQQFGGRENLTIFLIIFIFTLVNSFITGGRSNFMLIAAIMISAISARRDLTIAGIFPNRGHRLVIFLVIMLMTIYVVYVFYARAQAGEETVYSYVVSFLPYMGLDFDDWYLETLSDSWISIIGDMSILVFGYLTHSLATVAAIIDAPHEQKIVIFGNVASLLYKLGLIAKPDDDWFLAGRFPSVPGALWHQFGILGFVFGSLILGVISGLVTDWAARSSTHVFSLGVYALVGSTLILTPYVFGPDFLSYPFIFSALVVLTLLTKFCMRRRNQEVEDFNDRLS